MEEKVLRAAAEQADEQRTAASLFAELMALPAERWLNATEGEPRYWTLGLADRLLAAAEQARSGSARELAELARAVVRRLSWERYGDSALLDREVLARCLCADADRRRGAVAEAESALHALERRLASEPLDAPQRAVFRRYLARLRRGQGWHDEALVLLERAAALFKEWEEPTRAGECQNEMGWWCVEALDLPTAEGAFSAAVMLFSGNARPLPVAHAWLGLALCSAELGQPADAEHALACARPLYVQVPARIDRLQLGAIEAWIADGLGRAGEAVTLLESVISGLLAERAYFEAAVAAVDLIHLHAGRGRTAEIELLPERLAALTAPGVLPETSRAVLLLALRFGARQDRDTTELLGRCGELLRRRPARTRGCASRSRPRGSLVDLRGAGPSAHRLPCNRCLRRDCIVSGRRGRRQQPRPSFRR